MAVGNGTYSKLNRMQSNTQTYGRASAMRKSVQRELPTDLVFCDEFTGDVFQLSYNGAVQFLRKMQIDPCRQNVEWLIDSLLNISIDELFIMENAELSVSCSCTYDPQGKSLAEMGIQRSMVCKEPSMPPAQVQRIQADGSAQGMTEAQVFMRKCGMPIGDGSGILFGRNVVELSTALRKGTAGNGSYVGHDDTADVGGFIGRCNISNSYKPTTNSKGWQE